MITRKKPEAKTLAPKPLYDILCSSKDKNINVIENIIQRELVWTYACMETFWHDVLQCIKLNIESSKNDCFGTVYDTAYMVAGNIEYSKPDNCNEKHLPNMNNWEYKSIVDGSQRNRISIFMVLAAMYKMAEQNGLEYVNIDMISLPNGKQKLMEIGASTELSAFYEKIQHTPISELSKEIKKNTPEKLIKSFEKEDEKRDYFEVFSLYVHYIENDIIGTYTLSEVFKIILSNVYFYEEEVDMENKFDRFVDRNKKGTPMSDESMYPKYIVNQYEDAEKEYVYSSFKRFEAEAKRAQKEGHFRQTKSGTKSVLWIMIETLKIKLGEKSENNEKINLKNIFASTFDLGNIDYGVEKCFRNGYLFKTSDEAIDYFNECYDIAKFLIEESFYRHESIYEDCYYLRDFAKGDTIWWYFIKPSYLAQSRTKNNSRRFVFIKKLLYRIYCFYIVHRSGSTNSQNLINLLEKISEMIITGRDYSDDYFEKKVKERVLNYIGNAEGFNILYHELHALSYKIKPHKTAIETIFIAMEYDLCEKFSIPTDTFYGIWKRGKGSKSYNLDHWLPENKIPDDKNPEYQSIGNLVLLEEPLNKSKQDKKDVNSKYYTQSKYIQTLLMDENNRGTFYNNKIDKINSYQYLTRFDEVSINNPTLDDIKKRKENYINFFISFIQDFLK